MHSHNCQMSGKAYCLVATAVITALVAVPGEAYRILMLPQPVRSHVFPIFAMADGIAERGHEVTVLVHGSVSLDVPEVGIVKRQMITVLHHTDASDDLEAIHENITSSFLENQMSFKDQIPQITAA
jgi:hypothetical protein